MAACWVERCVPCPSLSLVINSPTLYLWGGLKHSSWHRSACVCACTITMRNETLKMSTNNCLPHTDQVQLGHYVEEKFCVSSISLHNVGNHTNMHASCVARTIWLMSNVYYSGRLVQYLNLMMSNAWTLFSLIYCYWFIVLQLFSADADIIYPVKTENGRWQYFPDTTGPNIRKGQTSVKNTQKRTHLSFLGGFRSVKLSVRRDEHSKELLLLFLFFFTFLNLKSIFLQDFNLLDCCRCVVELNYSECTFSPSNSFDTGIQRIWTFILNTRR